MTRSFTSIEETVTQYLLLIAGCVVRGAIREKGSVAKVADFWEFLQLARSRKDLS